MEKVSAEEFYSLWVEFLFNHMATMVQDNRPRSTLLAAILWSIGSLLSSRRPPSSFASSPSSPSKCSPSCCPACTFWPVSLHLLLVKYFLNYMFREGRPCESVNWGGGGADLSPPYVWPISIILFVCSFLFESDFGGDVVHHTRCHHTHKHCLHFSVSA